MSVVNIITQLRELLDAIAHSDEITSHDKTILRYELAAAINRLKAHLPAGGGE